MTIIIEIPRSFPMKLFLESHPNSRYGLKISEGQFSKQEKLVEIPMYALESWFVNKT